MSKILKNVIIFGLENSSVSCDISEEREEILECYGEHENVDFDRSVSCPSQSLFVILSPLLSLLIISCPSQPPSCHLTHCSCQNFFLSFSSNPYVISNSSINFFDFLFTF
jgi:hypothetical protein